MGQTLAAWQRARKLYTRITKKLGSNNIAPHVHNNLLDCLPRRMVLDKGAKIGLYAGKHTQHGWHISKRGGNRKRRTWVPNAHYKRLYSYVMDRFIRVKVSMYALRCIDKAGGFDEYLLKTPYQNMDTDMGLFWKAKVDKLYEKIHGTEVVTFPKEVEARFAERVEKMKRDLAAKNEKRMREAKEKMEPKVAADGTRKVPVSYILDYTDTKEPEKEVRDHGRRVFPGAGRIVVNF